MRAEYRPLRCDQSMAPTGAELGPSWITSVTDITLEETERRAPRRCATNRNDLLTAQRRNASMRGRRLDMQQEGGPDGLFRSHADQAAPRRCRHCRSCRSVQPWGCGGSAAIAGHQGDPGDEA